VNIGERPRVRSRACEDGIWIPDVVSETAAVLMESVKEDRTSRTPVSCSSHC